MLIMVCFLLLLLDYIIFNSFFGHGKGFAWSGALLGYEKKTHLGFQQNSNVSLILLRYATNDFLGYAFQFGV